MAAESGFSVPNPHESNNHLTFFTLSHINPLTTINYLNWERQVEAILDGFDLFKYPDGSHKPPFETIMNTETSVVLIPNPTFLTWKRKDRLVYGAILPTLTDFVASLVT